MPAFGQAAARLGIWLTDISDSPRRLAAAILGCGLVFAALEFGTHTAVMQTQIPDFVHSVLDACIIGATTAAMALMLFVSARTRRRRVLEELRKVAELNHEVRNALQVIVDSQYLPQSEQAATVVKSVDRIDSTLRDLFPAIGERSEDRQMRLLNEQKRAALLRARRNYSGDRRGSQLNATD
jgi:hypothetical protein